MATAIKLKQICLTVLATISWLAVVVQTFVAVQVVTGAGRSPILGVINTLSYFTILTNLIVAIVTTASALRGESNSFLTKPSTMSAVAVYIFIVGLIYSLLLRSIWDPTGLNAVLDSALHDVTPLLYVLYWFFFVPKGSLRWSQPVFWLIYPLLYVLYCIIRGEMTGLYPYHFVDVSVLGYPRALINTALLLIGFFLVGSIVVAIDRLMGAANSRRSQHSARNVPLL